MFPPNVVKLIPVVPGGVAVGPGKGVLVDVGGRPVDVEVKVGPGVAVAVEVAAASVWYVTASFTEFAEDPSKPLTNLRA